MRSQLQMRLVCGFSIAQGMPNLRHSSITEALKYISVLPTETFI